MKQREEIQKSETGVSEWENGNELSQTNNPPQDWSIKLVKMEVNCNTKNWQVKLS